MSLVFEGISKILQVTLDDVHPKGLSYVSYILKYLDLPPYNICKGLGSTHKSIQFSFPSLGLVSVIVVRSSVLL